MLSGTQLLKVHTLIRFEEHDCIQEAIVSGRRQLNADNSRRACDQLEGETIEAAEWSDRDALFRFANGKSMRVFVTPQGVQWAVDDSNRIEVPANVYPRSLLLQDKNDPNGVSWQRADILESRVGNPFVRIVKSGNTAFFYAERCPVLLFCPLLIDENRREEVILSWNDSD